MKTIKKLLSIAMVLALVLSLGVSAFAVDITIDEKNDTAVGTYKAYQLMTATVAPDAVEDGDGYSYTVNPVYSEILKTATGQETDEAVIEYLEGLRKSGTAADIRAFADAVYTAIKAQGITTTYTSENGKFSDIPQGYYLIAEEGDVAGGAVSQVMLDTAGRDSITIETKEEVPESYKKVMDANDSTPAAEEPWQDSADYDIGDDVPFQLTGKLPADIETYDEYEVIFHDTQSAGLAAPSISSVTVNGKAVDAANYELVADPDDDCTFHVKVTVKAEGIGADLTGGELVVVNYTSKLTEAAEVGPAGNPNTMFMEYTNDHYSDGTGKTKEDKVVVFTYQMEADKVTPDGEGSMKDLEGAAFTLYKKTATGDTLEGYDGSWTAVKEYTVTPGQTKFEFKGIDDGEYLLVETTVPAGYNKADDINFTVEATHSDSADEPKLLTFKATDKVAEGAEHQIEVDEKDTSVTGKFIVQVVNLTGMELPETGGIGTTIFYVAGAILVAGAVVLLVTKKRMTGAEK